ncbi:uncharacterized protein LOC113349367 [Papaver somniferum]|uniref:uncharacterized protein LOC113349367 n=1 Tax=Papaver somniferum TaxID=3469 RepID=UPI000E6F8C43|nr:uncharacterized protein LOC113349367 [Papaver somniferum]
MQVVIKMNDTDADLALSWSQNAANWVDLEEMSSRVLPSTMGARCLFGCTPHEQSDINLEIKYLFCFGSDTKDKMDSETSRVVASTFFRRLTSATRSFFLLAVLLRSVRHLRITLVTFFLEVMYVSISIEHLRVED